MGELIFTICYGGALIIAAILSKKFLNSFEIKESEDSVQVNREDVV